VARVVIAPPLGELLGALPPETLDNTRARFAHNRRALRHLASRVLRPGGVAACGLLASLPALVADEETVDPSRLAASGARVLGNPAYARACSASEPRAARPDPWHLERIGVEPFHRAGLTGRGIIVGILDSGVDITHPELAGVDIHFAAFDDRGVRMPMTARDFGVHGTHAAGLIAGRTVGVSPGATLAVAAVLTLRGGTVGRFAQILAGLDWLLSTSFQGEHRPPGCRIINAGLQIPGYNDFLRAPLLAAAIDPGVLMVAASGNEGTLHPGRLASPGNYDVALGVGATDRNDRVAPFSQFGTVAHAGGIAKPDLCAPGVDIWSSVPGGCYTSLSGTSQASPLVCGAGALLVEHRPDVLCRATALRAALLECVEPLPWQRAESGRGRLRLDHHLSARFQLR
jgi:serine protease AprX